MNPFTGVLAAMHVEDLVREAEQNRRARLAHQPTDHVSGWRRGLSRGALRLGEAFDSAATVLDPSLCLERLEQMRAAGSGSRSMAA